MTPSRMKTEQPRATAGTMSGRSSNAKPLAATSDAKPLAATSVLGWRPQFFFVTSPGHDYNRKIWISEETAMRLYYGDEKCKPDNIPSRVIQPMQTWDRGECRFDWKPGTSRDQQIQWLLLATPDGRQKVALQKKFAGDSASSSDPTPSASSLGADPPKGSGVTPSAPTFADVGVAATWLQEHEEVACEDREVLSEVIALINMTSGRGGKDVWFKSIAKWNATASTKICRQVKDQTAKWQNRPFGDIRDDVKLAVLKRIQELAAAAASKHIMPDAAQSASSSGSAKLLAGPSGASSSAQAAPPQKRQKTELPKDTADSSAAEPRSRKRDLPDTGNSSASRATRLCKESDGNANASAASSRIRKRIHNSDNDDADGAEASVDARLGSAARPRAHTPADFALDPKDPGPAFGSFWGTSNPWPKHLILIHGPIHQFTRFTRFTGSPGFFLLLLGSLA